MKFICTADLHITGKRPRMRKDKYEDAQFNKLGQIVDLCLEHDATLLIAADLADSWTMSNRLIRKVITALRPLNGKCLTVRGQHETAYHSKNLDRGPLGVLDASGVLTVLGTEDSQVMLIHNDDGHDVAVAGMGWQDEVPLVSTGYYNILLAHFSVYSAQPPPWMPDALSVREFEKKFPGFDSYVVGDIHQTCCKSKTIVPGSMMRMASNQKHHEPCVFLLDTENGTTKIPLKVEEDVFDLEAIAKEKEEEKNKEEIEKRLVSLTDEMLSEAKVVDFEETLLKVSAKSAPAVQEIIMEVMTDECS